ncbi:MAG: M48 family metallopeptidase [Isosphaeraceae bacterium]
MRWRIVTHIVGAGLLVALAASTSFADPGPGDASPVPVPQPSEKALRFHQTGHFVWAFGQILTVAFPAVLLVSGASARLRDRAARLTRNRWLGTVAVYLIVFLVIVFLVELPFRYRFGFVRLHEYGLSNQTFAKWLGDSFKGLFVDLVGAIAFAWIPFWLIGRFPRSWWLWMAAGGVPFIAFVALISPVLIDPLFNEFGPMQDKALEARILGLAQRAGIAGGRVYEVNKSVDTRTLNAYVTGLLGTHRIVLWDTLLEKFDEPQILAVMGHEMGHYVLRHVERGVVLSSVLLVVGLFWTDRAGRWALARWGERWGVRTLSDIAAAPLLLILIACSSVVLGPVGLAFSRYQEHEADRFALELTHLNHAAARAFSDFQRENLGIPRPDPFCALFRSSHPCAADRIEFSNTYRPWETGQPSRYAPYFTPEATAH